jgi:membrane protease subunit (stomatin/prohibitin family)
MGENWNSTIETPEIKISGLRSPQIKTTNYIIIASRNSYNKSEAVTQNQQSESLIISNIKFCFNCGTPNDSFAFCPNCGTKLKQN